MIQLTLWQSSKCHSFSFDRAAVGLDLFSAKLKLEFYQLNLGRSPHIYAVRLQ
ncbi:hypothetical protein BH18ACI2_BH18ACI2_27610 [soil metagenome]